MADADSTFCRNSPRRENHVLIERQRGLWSEEEICGDSKRGVGVGGLGGVGHSTDR